MKKLLLLCLVPVFTHTWQYYSFVDQKFTTVPATEDIDQDKYHELCCIVNVILTELVNCNMSRAQRAHYVNSYLTQVNSAESTRLIADLKELSL